MKTLRYRIGNDVKPGILDAEENILDASSLVSDWDSDNVTVEKLSEIKNTDISSSIIFFVNGPICLNIILPSLFMINVSGKPKTPNSRAIFPFWSRPTKEYGFPSSFKYFFESAGLSLWDIPNKKTFG